MVHRHRHKCVVMGLELKNDGKKRKIWRILLFQYEVFIKNEVTSISFLTKCFDICKLFCTFVMNFEQNMSLWLRL